jgi:hypothetical protein
MGGLVGWEMGGLVFFLSVYFYKQLENLTIIYIYNLQQNM